MGDASRQAACDLVYRKYPLLAGVRPSTQAVGPNRVYTFTKDVPTSPGGPSLRQIVRVTVNPAGKVVKVVASR